MKGFLGLFFQKIIVSHQIIYRSCLNFWKPGVLPTQPLLEKRRGAFQHFLLKMSFLSWARCLKSSPSFFKEGLGVVKTPTFPKV
jgi:hypothetical protein